MERAPFLPTADANLRTSVYARYRRERTDTPARLSSPPKSVVDQRRLPVFGSLARVSASSADKNSKEITNLFFHRP